MNVAKKQVGQNVSGYLFMLIGGLAYAVSTAIFLAKNNIVAGGISGLAVLLNYLNENLPVGATIIVLNIPILLLGLKFEGWRFILRALITIMALGLVTDAIAEATKDTIMTDDALLASIYGGICQGVGIGCFVRFQFSSGGTELLGRVISRVIKIINIPVCVGILDAIVVIAGSAFTHNPTNLLYALIVIFVSTKVSELILMGLEKSKLCIIITDKGQEVSETLIKNSPRGVTMLDGVGMYTQKNHNVLLTCVKNRQLTQLKCLVKSVDPNAFIVINESVEVRGQGFQSLEE